MKVNVHLLRPPAEEPLAHLQAHLHPDIHLTMGDDLTGVSDFHILVAGRPQHQHLSASPALHTLIIPWAGLPAETRTLLQEAFPHIAAHNLHHNAVPVAETAVALLLAAAKRLTLFDRSLRRHDWRPRYQRPIPSLLLSGKTALILGYGAIGQNIAQKCQALGMRVLATRRRTDEVRHDGVAEVHSAAALPSLLPQAQALIISLPLTPHTEGLIGVKELASLPDKAVLVNVGRGPVVDEAALYRALEEGKLHAAGLDVWYNYPEDVDARAHTPPANYPFHKLDNLVMSPHRAGSSDESERLRMTHLARLLTAAAQGELMPNRIDLAAGY